MRKRILGVFIVLLIVLATSAAFANDDYYDGVGDTAKVMRGATPIPAGHYALIAHYADKYLSSTDPSPARAISITKFDSNLYNIADFYVIDIRAASAYAGGHVPGAVNVPFATIAKPWNLATYPTDRPILVICYSGHTASMTSSILNLLGYNAWVLKGGMPSWDCSSHYCEY